MEQKSLRRRFAALLLMLCLLAAGALPALATSANIRLVDASGNPATGTIRVALYDSAKDKALSGGQLTLYRVAEVKRKNGDLSFEYCGDFYGCGIALGDLTDSTLADQLLEYMPQGARGTTKTVDADGNADHAKAFIQGMADSGVGSAIKHYPGLGSVTGNTDFTADGILDTTTTLDGAEIGAFNSTLEANPSMVMMSLATYQAIDPNNPAVFSSALVTDYLRNTVGFQGVITSDSLSATALGGIQPSDLGVRLVEAGGDLACIGAFNYVQQVLDGLNAKAAADSAFADKVTQSAIRVMTLKYSMGLAS